MKKYAILDKDGNVLNTIIYDGIAKYEIEKNKSLKDISNDKFKYAEKEDKIVSDSLEKKIIPVIAEVIK